MADNSERRRENRVEVAWKAKVGSRILGIEPAIVKNVSLSGVYFETRLTLPEHNKIFLESHLEHAGNTHTLLVECEVMRYVSTNRPEIHGYGAQFVKLGKANLTFLLPLIAELWLQQRDRA